MPRSFVLTPALLALHRSGVPLCLAPSVAQGASLSMRAERPGAWERRSVASKRRASERARLLAADGAEADRFGIGDRVEPKTPHMPEASGPGTIEIVDPGPAYGIRFDRAPKEIHRWYVGSELTPLAGPAGAPPDMMPGDGEPMPPSSRPGMTPGPAVAVLSIRGILCSEVSAFDCGFADGYSGEGSIVDQAREADADPNVCAVVWDIMSPGGDALGLGEAAAQLAALRAASSKPWLVYARQACSAACWLAAGAAGPDGLFVSESSDVGNVGTWIDHTDYSGANEKEGVVRTYIADPPGKILGNPDQPLDPEARARLQARVSETTSRFVAALVAYRPQLSADAVRALDGNTRRGAAAVAAGLADGLASSLEEVIALAYQRSSAMRAPAFATSAGMPPASKGPQDMPLSAAVLSALPEAARSSDAAAEAALLPLLSFAASALALAGKDDLEAAIGVLRADRKLAAEVPALRAKVAAEEARAEEAERVQELEAAVKEGLLKPGEVWTWSDPKDAAGNVIVGAAQIRGIAPVWAAPKDGVGKTMTALRAEIAHLRAVGPRTLAGEKEKEAKEPSAEEMTRQAAIGSLSPDQLRFCASRKIDPAKFAALYASNFAAAAAPKG